jgi:hypothetical protein
VGANAVVPVGVIFSRIETEVPSRRSYRLELKIVQLVALENDVKTSPSLVCIRGGVESVRMEGHYQFGRVKE